MIIPSASDQMGPGGYGLGHSAIPRIQRGLVVGTQVGLTTISLVGLGKFLRAGGALGAADAALVRLYQSGRLPLIGGSTYYPPGWVGPAVTMIGGTVSTWFTPDSSSGVGGPGELPNLHRPPPSIEEAGEILSNPPIVSDSSKPEPASYPLPADSAGIGPGKHNPCARGYSPKKIKGRWFCVKKGR